MVADLLPLLAGGGVSGTVLLLGYLLHRDAVRTHDKRADRAEAAAAEWKSAYLQERARSDERERQLQHVLAAVKRTTGSEVT